MARENIEKQAYKYAFVKTLDIRERFLLSCGFKDGAKWRINSMWHDAGEIPTIENENILAIGEDDIVMPIRLCENFQESWAHKVKYLHIKEWAYVKDLLPIK